MELSISRHPLAPVKTHKKQALGTEGKPGVNPTNPYSPKCPLCCISATTTDKAGEYPWEEFNQPLV